MTADRKALAARAWRPLRLAVAVGLVGFLLARAGIGDFANGTFSWGWLLLSIALVPLSVGIRAWNHTLLLNRDVRVLGAWEALRLALIGAGLGILMPQSAADLAKAHYGWRAYGHAEDMVISSVLDRLTSLTAVAAMSAAGAAVSGRPLFAWLAAALTAATLLPVAFPRAMPWRLLLRFLAPGAQVSPEAVVRAARPPLPLLLKVYAVSLAGWLFTYTIMYCTLRAVGGVMPLAYVLAVAPLCSIARFVPVSVGGIGLGEVTLAAMLTGAGEPQTVAARAVLLSMLVLVLLPGGAGLLLLAVHRGIEAGSDDTAEEAAEEV